MIRRAQTYVKQTLKKKGCAFGKIGFSITCPCILLAQGCCYCIRTFTFGAHLFVKLSPFPVQYSLQAVVL